MKTKTQPASLTRLACLAASVVLAASLPGCISVSREVKEVREVPAPVTVREVRTTTHAPASSSTTTVTTHR